jgi:hypothetical protein
MFRPLCAARLPSELQQRCAVAASNAIEFGPWSMELKDQLSARKSAAAVAHTPLIFFTLRELRKKLEPPILSKSAITL